MATLFLVFREPGPAWVPGIATRSQALWGEHAAFMDRLFEQGRIVLGGPYADESRVLLIVDAHDAAQARALLDDDPWTAAGILPVAEVIAWNVFLDSRRTPSR